MSLGVKRTWNGDGGIEMRKLVHEGSLLPWRYEKSLHFTVKERSIASEREKGISCFDDDRAAEMSATSAIGKVNVLNCV